MPTQELPGHLLQAQLDPVEFHSRDCLNSPSKVPKLAAGVYAWFFDQVPPGVPTDGCHSVTGRTLLYVGIAPKETRKATTRPSERTLLHRLRDHFCGNAEGSTLRLTLGCLLADQLGMKLRRVGSGNRFTFTNPGEQLLDDWMAQHARVVWAAAKAPWETEKALMASLALPLNLQGNKHPFVAQLKGIRQSAKATAKAMPIVADNGGPRRPV